ncbi:MAG TPA: hypothetical protein EYP36_03195, partial [Calditrichaeota bacterium]|nr:hypothetical protein [Calditrichota bacterium]
MKETKEVRITHKTKELILDHYHCTLFLPLTGLEKTDFIPSIKRQYYCHDSTLEKGEAAGFYYFSPTVRDILYDCPKKPRTLTPIKEWRLPTEKLEKWELHLGQEKYICEYAQYQKSKVTSVRLLQYFNGLYLLAIRLEPLALYQLKKQEETATLYDAKENNISYFINKDKKNTTLYQQLIMEDWMHFSRLVRLIYPSFEQQTVEDKIAPIHLIKDGTKISAYDYQKTIPETKIKIPKSAGENFSPVILEFIKAFAKRPENVEKQVKQSVDFYDDRMFISVAYGIAGPALPAHSLEGINTLVSHIDRQEADGWDKLEGGYAYTPQVIREKTKKQAYSLWEGLGVYYTFTDFSNTYLSTGGEFRSYIAPDHIPHIYDRMLIQALFYQASLRHYDNEICTVTEGFVK